MKDLTTTSYAILGLLALRDWTTYELAKQMERSLRNFWPRAESKLYEEPKKLVAHGLATSRRQSQGRRRSTVYSITPKGRTALRSWLGEPGDGPVLEFEALMKVFFADQGDKEQLLRTIRGIEDWALQDMAQGAEVVGGYLEDGGPFPERLHIIRLMVSFLMRRTIFIREWARWAEREVERWPGVTGKDVPRVPKDVFRRAVREGGTDVGDE